MKLSSLNIFKNSVTATTLHEEFYGMFASMNTGAYSDTIIKMVLSPIFDELKKVSFYSEDAYRGQVQFVVDFLNANYATIFKYFFIKGYCAVKLNQGIEFDNQCYVKSKNEFQIKLSNPLSAMTFDFDFFQKSSKELVREVLENINTGMTAQKAITKILGQFTFFSKEKEGANERVVPLTDAERAIFEAKFNTIFSGDNVGSAVNFTNANLKRDTVLFPMEKLQIVDNVGFCTLILAGVMNVPYDLIPITGKSTYSNQEEAINYLRTHTVSGIAENMLELGRKILKAKYPMIPKKAIDYKIIIETNTHQAI